MVDYVFPDNNENEFIKVASILKIRELCFVYDKFVDVSKFQSNPEGVVISFGIVCEGKNVQKFRGKYTTLVRAPQDVSVLRNVFEQYKPHVVFGLESQHRGDFVHHRASGLNQVLSVLARNNDITVGFSFFDLLTAKPWYRQRILGRMKQNIMFSKKFKFKTCFGSFAKHPWQLRSKRSLKDFFEVL